MSLKAIRWAWKLARATVIDDPAEMLVLLALADQAHAPEEAEDPESASEVCFPGVPYLSRSTCLSQSTVRDRLRRLEERGIITRTPRYRPGKSEGTGGQTSNEYALRYDQTPLRTTEGVGSPPPYDGGTPSVSRRDPLRIPEGPPPCHGGREPSSLNPSLNQGEEPTSGVVVRKGETGAGAEKAPRKQEPPRTPAPVSLTWDTLRDLWDEIVCAKGLSKLKLGSVDKRLRAQMIEALGENDDREWWRTVIERATDSKFLLGFNDDKRVIVSMHWLTRKLGTNARDVAIGKYGLGRMQLVPTEAPVVTAPVTHEQSMELSGAKRRHEIAAARKAKEEAQLVDAL